MRILIAEDDLVSRRVLETTLIKGGHEVVVTCDGAEAWEALRREDAPSLVVLDWMMPGLDGVEVCQRIRQMGSPTPPYILLLTAKVNKADIVLGLNAGADDYITKPFDRYELHARIHVGARVVQLRKRLAERVKELEDAFAQIKQLQGILPICSYCKNIRDDRNYWQRVENYISEHSEAKFSHSICPDCYESVVQSQLARVKAASSMKPIDVPETS